MNPARPVQPQLSLLLIICCFSLQLFALEPNKKFEQYVLDTWSIEQGLPQITVNAIVQGHDHYLWVATQAGLARFDGVQFVTFSTDNTPGLVGNFVLDLHAGQDGKIWIATYKGLSVYDSGIFKSIQLAPAQTSSEQLNVNTIAETANGEIWVSASEGVFYIKQGQLHKVEQINAATQDIIAIENTVYASTQGNLWQIKEGQVRTIKFPEFFSDATVNQSEFYQNRLWLGTNKGLLTVSGQRNNIMEFGSQSELFHYPVDALGKDSDGNLWVGTIKGLFRIYDNEVKEFVDESNRNYVIQVQTILEDHEKNLWFGSYIDGIARIWNGRTTRYSESHGLEEKLVWTVLPKLNSKAVWTGTNRGLSLLKDQKFTEVLKPEQLPHPTVYTLLEEPEQLWIGTRKGLTRYNDGKVLPVAHADELASIQISSIVRDSKQRLWLGTSEGLYRYTENELIKYKTQDNEAILVRPVVEMPNGEIWIGTQKGIYRVVGEELERIGAKNNLPNSIDVTSIIQLEEDIIVAATLSQGLYVYDGKVWRHITEDDGLPVNESFTLIVDPQSQLWISGFKGLFKMPVSRLIDFVKGRDTELGAFMYLSESGGIVGSQKAFCCNGAGNAKGFLQGENLWYPTRDGVVSIDTTKVQLNPFEPKVFIEKISFNEAWLVLNSINEINLAAKQRDLAFDFTALSFRDPKSVQFEYRLKGYQDQWRKLDTKAQRRVNYTNLPPGDYVFSVKASNNAGVWTKQATELKFNIAPFFFETLWFYGLCFIVLALIVSVWHRLRLRSLQQKKLELEEQINQRTQQLEISNEKLNRAVVALKEASVTDQLSGLRNRRYLDQQLPADLPHLHREFLKHDQPMILLLMDIDHFKNINDNYGHLAGDNVIQSLSAIILEKIRDGDYAVRWGGEEFLIVFRPMPREKAPEIAERLRAAIEHHDFAINSTETIKVTCSIGFSEYPFFKQSPTILNWEQGVDLADQALYYVKQHGRNGWAYFKPTESTPQDTSVLDLLKNSLDAAIESEKITLHNS
ncbi:MAG: diguanylate cyclase [Gammaproteobacteria bacterium]|nr:diguanylate cyclase [Gammaproteobacteria bacterium]